MPESLESTVALANRGRPATPVRNADTGQIFADCFKAAEWLATVGVEVQPQTIRNCVGEGRRAGGFLWEWYGVRPKGGKSGPMKGCGGRPPKGATRPANLVPRTPVCCPDTGESYPDAWAAAAALRDAGFADATALRIVQAIADGVRVCDRYWDWKGRGEFFCGQEQDTGVICDDCKARRAKSTLFSSLEA